jgi:RNA recognition motif-containing protein
MVIAAPPRPWYSAAMGNRLFVGNLPFHATEDMVQAAFAPCGDIVEVALVLDRVSGRSRGFAFVEMATPEGAQKAIETLDGQDLGGRPLKVNQAEERRGGGGGGGGGGRSDRPRRW